MGTGGPQGHPGQVQGEPAVNKEDLLKMVSEPLVKETENPWREGAQSLMDNGEVLGAVIFAGMSQTADMTNTVIANLERERDELRATVDLIREGVYKAFANPWMPQPNIVEACLYPYPPMIEQRVKLNKENREAF